MSRCLLISNRLPIVLDPHTKEFIPSSGGLVSAIKGLDPAIVGYDFEWMGVMTDDVDSEKLDQLKTMSFGNIPCHPVIVPKDKYHLYYNCYCNDVIWPLFHYERSLVHHTEESWHAYVEVNQLMADAILREANEADTIWVHDFHFFMVPGMVKGKKPNLKVGFFLHIPFPSSEVFREIPERKEILSSLLQCDLIGFHDLSYLNHFKSSLQRIIGEVSIPISERKLGVYPISIDTKHFLSLVKAPETKDYISRYLESKKNIKWVLGVDRLDYIKGLLLKLKAFRTMLEKYPEEVGKVQLVQIVIPSRTEVPEYQQLKHKVEQLVSSINGKFGTPTYMPIFYIYNTVSEQELSALYQLSEVMFIGSRRDGMNLVSLEYIVSQHESHPGTLLLSEFAGAHSTLSYAFSINPWNVEDTAIKLHEALHHPEEKRRAAIKSMKDFLIRYTSSDWAKVILRDLHRPSFKEKITHVSATGEFPWMNKLKGKRVLFFCDLDGTLAPISNYPADVRIQEKTAGLLRKIGENDHCEFVVVSGRDKEFLEKEFADNDYPFTLAACHGAYTYSHEDKQWHNLIPHDSTKWKEQVLEVLKMYATRTPGSFIEDKGYAITWHYRNSPPEFAEFLANKLYFELDEILTSLPVQVSKGKKVIEVKSIHANKGFFVQQWIMNQKYKPDIVVAIGDDTTDEDMFDSLQDRDDFTPFCIKVGKENTHANYFIQEQKYVNRFLEKFIAHVSSPPPS
jgi:trehalose 6-phosphate synthase/phosphatase